ncbi:MAG: hypothetical protein HZC14_02780 [Candidatus Niyogibacteria bacterium]|nr:hypothetical protein [Candidatus Niyogibacteria bacterium]
MEIWTRQNTGEKHVWKKQPFGNFPDKNKSLREAVLEHLEYRNNGQYPEIYWIVFSAKEEEKMNALAMLVMPYQILAPYPAAETFLKYLLDFVDRMHASAPVVVYISENPNEFVVPPFRLALMFRIK